jgi:hypothetical protein
MNKIAELAVWQSYAQYSGKDILFCNFWLANWLVRIANAYGF